MSGTYAVKRPVAWLGGILLLALIVLAIVLPITARKEEDVVVARYEGHYPYFQPFAQENDPFNLLTEEQRKRAEDAFRGMSSEQKRGHINVYPTYEDLTGPPVDGFDNTAEALEKMIREGLVGAFLNYVDPEEIVAIQTNATAEESPNTGYPLMLGYDIIHGFATIFPVNLGMASAFDPQMIYDHAAWAATEARSVGLNWNYGPMLDVSRDPRWGRVSEGSGEDAYLAGVLGAAYIEGFQDNGVAACVKHVGAYGVTRAGRDYTSGEMGRLTLFNQYFEAYRRGFKAKPLTAMASFNSVFRNAAHMNRELLQDILRNQWGFDGFVVADWSGPTDMFAMRVVANQSLAAAGEASLEAGVDMNMSDMAFWVGLKDSANNRTKYSGRTYQDHMDLAVKRILAVKERLNVWEDPIPSPADVVLPLPGAMDFAEEVAEKSAVLLKNGEVNGEKVLPIDPSTAKELWLVGSIAENPRDHQGSWSSSGKPYTSNVVTVKKALEERRGSEAEGNWKYFQGYETTWRTEEHEEEARLLEEVVEAFRAASPKPETVVFVVGENCNQSGEGTSRTNLTMSGTQLVMVKRIHEINQATPASQRSKLVYVVMAGRPLTLPWEAENLDAILYAWNNGSRGGPALWNLLFGDKSPSGKLPITMARNVGQLPIYYQFRGHRAQLTRKQWDDILDPHYCLWDDNKDPSHHRYPIGGRCYMSNYIDSQVSPLYWFGHGLTYSEFEYANIEVTRDQIGLKEVYGEPRPTVTVTLQVKRVGGRRDIAATEIVQIYVRDNIASVMPTWKNLRGFARVDFDALDEEPEEPEVKTVSITLDIYEDFGFWNEQMEWVVEPGRFDIIVGKSAHDEAHVVPFYVVDNSGRTNLPLGASAD